MGIRSTFSGEALSAEDLSALKELAAFLWNARHEVAEEWSRRLMQTLPEHFPPAEVSLEQITVMNAAFLSLVLSQVEGGDMNGLFQAFYDMNRQLIDGDLQRAPANRISLASLYTSASLSLRVISDRLGPEHAPWTLAYAKLTAHLMMLVGQAYSDSREGYLQRVFEQINTLSHELRAPLSHLFAYLEMLRDGEYGTVSIEQQSILSKLIHETDDLIWLLSGTLDLSRLDTGRVEVRTEEFPLTAVLADVVNLIPHPNVQVTWSVPAGLPSLRTDRVKLKQIVGNLLRNAIHYGAGSPVAVTAAVVSPAVVEVSVRDWGPGIESDALRVIFDLFERGTAVGLARDGYGVGLHVVRRLATLLGGAVAVDSSPGQGSCFRVTIPMDAQPSAAPPAT